jgi:hypothetical protein
MILMSIVFATTLIVAGIMIGGLAVVALGNLPRGKRPCHCAAATADQEAGDGNLLEDVGRDNVMAA